MKEWSDEELDKLFRKSAEEFEPQYEPNDWKELHRRLDAADDQAVGGSWMERARPWTLALLLLMMIGGISVYYNKSSRVGGKRDTIPTASSATRSPEASGRTNKSDERTPYTQPTDPGKCVETLRQDKAQLAVRPSAARPNKESTDATRLYGHSGGEERKEIKELPRNLASVSGVRKQTDLVKQGGGNGAILLPKTETIQASEVRKKKVLIQGRESFVDKKANKSSDIGAVGDRDGENDAAKGDLAMQQTPLRDEWPSLDKLEHRAVLLANDGPKLPDVAAEELTFTPERSAARVPKLAIRIGVSPDLSVVNMHMNNFTRPGPAGSILAEYSLAPRWAVQVGVIRSLKTYSAQAGDYEWPSNWYQKQRPTSIDGTCQVFELPLNIRYDISQRDKGRWFAGAGISSYKMQKEKYVYHYAAYDPNIRWWKWEGKTGWYFLSHANASAGYERRLTERLSLMAEPYVRVPLRKVGFGKVNLFSMGIWFSVRYTPVFR